MTTLKAEHDAAIAQLTSTIADLQSTISATEVSVIVILLLLTLIYDLVEIGKR